MAPSKREVDDFVVSDDGAELLHGGVAATFKASSKQMLPEIERQERLFAEGETNGEKDVKKSKKETVKEAQVELKDLLDDGVRRNITRMRLVFPNFPESDLHQTLLLNHGNVQQAMAALVSDDEEESAEAPKKRRRLVRGRRPARAPTPSDDDDVVLLPAARKRKSAPASVRPPTKRQHLEDPATVIMSGVKRAADQAAKPVPPTKRQNLEDVSTIKCSTKRAASRASTASPKPKKARISDSTNDNIVVPDSPATVVTLSDTDSDSDHDEDQEALTAAAINKQILELANTASLGKLVEFTNCSRRNAELIIAERPHHDVDDIDNLKHGGKGRSIGPSVTNAARNAFTALNAVDEIVAECDVAKEEINAVVKTWGGEEGISTEGLCLKTFSKAAEGNIQILGKPQSMAESLIMKDYQLVGLNWLNLLYEKKMGAILADDMGLGKTVQVISFLSHLADNGNPGPHVVIAPNSVLANWGKELEKFAPNLTYITYHAKEAERREMAWEILKDRTKYNVILTTYTTASNDYKVFLRKLVPETMTFDEGHIMKNAGTALSMHLLSVEAKFRLVLTGTPLQNNLQELMNMVRFIMPAQSCFHQYQEQLSTFFKPKNPKPDAVDLHTGVVYDMCVERARAIVKPFILRRQKESVLQDLPPKNHHFVPCKMMPLQEEVYKYFEQKHRDCIASKKLVHEGQQPPRDKENTLMNRRLAAIHPLLFDHHYQKVSHKMEKIMQQVLKRELGKWNKHVEKQATIVHENNDFQNHQLCMETPELEEYILKNQEWLESGKLHEMLRLLEEFEKEGAKSLIFSQFTNVLDIIEAALNDHDIKFVRLDGATHTDDRENLIEEFHNDPEIKVFLITTKTGGAGINLACANKVIIFDTSFNPQDDVQAENRAHRVGQMKPVDVYRLVTENSIEEEILEMHQSKLLLDQRISDLDPEKTAQKLGAQLEKKIEAEFLKSDEFKKQEEEFQHEARYRKGYYMEKGGDE
ncbi:hypothetical protein EJ06DRAFT_527405 [Trichodelitschia bisporula]|uniref:SNF2 family helicase/ATPase-like protein n=1 Tax=Trichodelitschia bisporula TaxID=703511 RepID=A0A6G1I734_9PEZI|nr:hypothetical protein EJ06DRAFT_527405 [Trichodelitschia bisporula]